MIAAARLAAADIGAELDSVRVVSVHLDERLVVTASVGGEALEPSAPRHAPHDADALLRAVLREVGACVALLGGVDLLLFSGAIDARARALIAERLAFLGLALDAELNASAQSTAEQPIAWLSAPGSAVRVAVVPAPAPQPALRLPVAVSARHIHLTQEAVEALFGAGHQLTPLRPLSQPGQFACEETLTVVGPKRALERVRVLGPTRSACQVEISRTDERHLGLDAPVRASGDVAHSPGVTLVAPDGKTLAIDEGVICAWRHVHMTPADAEAFAVQDGDIVQVALDTDGRDLILGDVLVRVNASYALEVHIDTDEANAAELRPGDDGALVRLGVSGVLRRSG